MSELYVLKSVLMMVFKKIFCLLVLIYNQELKIYFNYRIVVSTLVARDCNPSKWEPASFEGLRDPAPASGSEKS